MNEIKVMRQATHEWLNESKVFEWPVQIKAVATIPHFNKGDEYHYLADGEAVLSANGDEIHLKAGDLVFLPKGIAYIWEILEPLRVHQKTILPA